MAKKTKKAAEKFIVKVEREITEYKEVEIELLLVKNDDEIELVARRVDDDADSEVTLFTVYPDGYLSASENDDNLVNFSALFPNDDDDYDSNCY